MYCPSFPEAPTMQTLIVRRSHGETDPPRCPLHPQGTFLLTRPTERLGPAAFNLVDPRHLEEAQPMGRIRTLAIAAQRRGCHAMHRPSSPTLGRARLRQAGKEASGSAVPFGEPSRGAPSLLRSVVARLSLLPESSGVIPEHSRKRGPT